MPRDPVSSINEEQRAFERQQNELRKEAVSLAAKFAAERMGPEARNLTRSQMQELVDRHFRVLQQRESNIEPPGAGIGSIAEIPSVPRRALARGLNMFPDSARPESTLGALGLGAVEDAVEGREVGLENMGDVAGLVLPAAGAALPQLRPLAAGAAPIRNRLLQQLGGATAGAGMAGGAQQILDNAERLRDKAEALNRDRLSRSVALRESLETTPIEQTGIRMLSEAMLESTMGGAFVFGPQLARAGFAEFAGLAEPQVDKLMGLARQFNVDLDIESVTNSRMISRGSDVLGRIPVVSRRFVGAARRRIGQTTGAIQDSLSGIAPIVTEINRATRGEAGDRILNANLRAFNKLQSGFRSFKTDVDQAFNQFRAEASRTGATVGPANTQLMAVIERAAIRKLPKEAGKRPQPSGNLSTVSKQLDRVIKMDANPGLEEFINRGHEIENLISSLPPNSRAVKILIKVKQAMEQDINENLVGPASVLQMRDRANQVYSDGIALFSGQAAKRLRRVDRSFGRVRLRDISQEEAMAGAIPNPGASSPNIVIESMMKSDDPAVIRNLHSILTRSDAVEGEMVFREMVGLDLVKKMEESTVDAPNVLGIQMTSIPKLRKALGLDAKASPRFAANREKFRQAGASIEELDQVLEFAEQTVGEGVPDISTMVSRRLMLGGLGSAVRTFTPGASAARGQEFAPRLLTQIVSTAGTMIALRGIGKQLTDPAVLRAYRNLLDPRKSAAIRSKAVRRLLILDASFLAIDDITGGRVSESQRIAAEGPGDVLNAIREGGRNASQFDVIRQPLPPQGQGGVR